MNATAIKFIPEDERPRERLMSEGVEALSLTELIAIILSTGTKGKSALDLAGELICHFKTLDGLLDATIQELTQIKGIGKAKAITLKAVFGVVQRNQRSEIGINTHIRYASQAYELARDAIAHEKKEILFIILRDIKKRLIHSEKVAVGTLSEVLFHPREVFYPAIRHKAHSVIIAHNHPSGDPTPSQSDIHLTSMLSNSSRIMGIEFDDHLIVTPNRFISLREKGYLNKAANY